MTEDEIKETALECYFGLGMKDSWGCLESTIFIISIQNFKEVNYELFDKLRKFLEPIIRINISLGMINWVTTTQYLERDQAEIVISLYGNFEKATRYAYDHCEEIPESFRNWTRDGLKRGYVSFQNKVMEMEKQLEETDGLQFKEGEHELVNLQTYKNTLLISICDDEYYRQSYIKIEKSLRIYIENISHWYTEYYLQTHNMQF